MRPLISVPQKFGLFDLVARIPRSLLSFQTVAEEVAGSALPWRAIVGAFLAIGVFNLCIAGVGDLVAPDPSDTSTEDLGAFGYAAFGALVMSVLLCLCLLLQWSALRLLGQRVSARTVTVALLASQLPLIPIAAFFLAVSGVAFAAGANTGAGSAVYFLDIAIQAVLFCSYLTVATAVTVRISMPKATLAVLIGPGLLVALLLWGMVATA